MARSLCCVPLSLIEKAANGITNRALVSSCASPVANTGAHFEFEGAFAALGIDDVVDDGCVYAGEAFDGCGGECKQWLGSIGSSGAVGWFGRFHN